MPVRYIASGTETTVNTATASDQRTPVISRLPNGGYIIVWATIDATQDGTFGAIKAQIFGANGLPVGSEFLVNEFGAGSQFAPQVATLTDGTVIVTWGNTETTSGFNEITIEARRFDMNGVPLGGEFTVNTLGGTSRSNPSVTALANGGYAISWDDFSNNSDVFAQIYNADGSTVGANFWLNSGTVNTQTSSDITALSNGNFVAVWSTSNTTDDGSGNAVKARIFDTSGNAVGVEFLVNSFTSGNQTTPSVTALANGSFVVLWVTADTTRDGSSSAIVGQVFSAAGLKIGSEFVVNALTSGAQSEPVATALADGGFAVSWTSDASSGDGIGTGISLQIFTASGVRVGTEVRVQNDFTASQFQPDIETLSDGRLVVTWVNTDGDGSGYGIRQRFLSPNAAAPVITSNGGDATATVTAAENQTTVTTVTAADPEAQPLTYSIAGGADAARFTINSTTGALRFVTAPNFELPVDADGNNVYQVVVAASDGDFTDTQTLSVTVTNVNEAPVISSNGGGLTALISVLENQTAVTTVAASDGEGSTITYSITGGFDAARFAINSSTGVLSFVNAPNREAPTDAGLNNIYDVIVTASDGTLVDTQAIAVTVLNVNEAPIITSNGGGDTAAITINENSTAVSSVTSTDPENAARTYSIAGGVDAARFTINATTGALAFLSAPNHEAPTDANGDNVYEVIVRASDGTLVDTQAVSVTVANVNEAPVITSDGGGASAAVSVIENGTAAATVAVSDVDGPSVTFSISGGADAALFAIDAATGALSFVAAPDYEAPGDADANNIYEVVVQANDGTLSDTQAISVSVGNINEAPVITSDGGGASAAVAAVENSIVVTTVTANDVDGPAISFAITGGADAALFTIDPVTGVLSFVAIPDVEAPADAGADNIYDVIVAASDGSLVDTQSLAISVGNSNEAPEIVSGGGGASASYAIAENGTSVATVAATDPDGDSRTYMIIGGADAALFEIDAVTGLLSFIGTPDFEEPLDTDGNNVYEVVVQASDGTLSDTQAISVTVGNVNEAPVITSNGGGAGAAVAAFENGIAVTTVTAGDVDGPSISFAIAGGADAALFAIDAVTGVVSFIAAPDFEAPLDAGGDNVYDVLVSASDGLLLDFQALAISVANLNEAPEIISDGGGASASLAMTENGSAVTTVSANDPDGDPRTYAIVGGADAVRFAIDAVTGALSFIGAPDFEAPTDADGNNVYDVVVSASDGSLIDTQSLSIIVGNANEAPVITSNGGGAAAAVTINENQLGVATVASSDPEGNPRSYAIVGGADAARFAIDAVTGALSFVAGPNFEAPTDAGANNVYDVVVQASDGTLIDTQSIAVTIANVNEAPVITSNGGGVTASVAVNENTTAVTTITSTDPEGATRTYSIVGGADAARFTVNASTGVLSFVSAPNFEAPADVGANNVYDVIVSVSDGVNATSQALAVAVNNVVDGSTINGTNSANTLTGTNAEDTINGLGGNDTITGGLGRDMLTGGNGADRFTFTSLAHSQVGNMDVITDFNRSQNDRISLSSIDANANVAGDQAFTFIGTAAFGNVAGQLRYQVVGGNTIISGDVNGDGVADFAIQVNGTPTPIASDFIL